MRPITLSSIFTEKIFRIPDYQRGYSWRNQIINNQLSGQLVDFWDDIINLSDSKTHYTGLLTLEEVSEAVYKNWQDDLWLIKGKSFTPYFIVDGQQRLTTCIILIQCIIERAQEIKLQTSEEIELNFTSIEDISKQFIFNNRSGGISRTYIFGYEKDNPSYEFLKTKIFNEHSSTNDHEETLYTFNLAKAKEFFKDQLGSYTKDQLESLYSKLAQKLVFNEYIIESDLDVFIAFETMNNRGKPLSNLELLKNRLIYLSTLYPDKFDNDKSQLRKNINGCWKTVYQYLGKNKDILLNDDVFLRAHWIVYFTYSRRKGNDYARFLLNQRFKSDNVLAKVEVIIKPHEQNEFELHNDDDLDEENLVSEEENDDENLAFFSKLKIEEIHDYVTSLQKAAKHWYNIYNPLNNADLSLEEQNWLDRIKRVGMGNFPPLILSLYCSEPDSNKRIKVLKAIENYIFLLFRVSQQRANTGDSEFYRLAKLLYEKNITSDVIVTKLNDGIQKYLDLEKFTKYIKNKFLFQPNEGFYGWSGIRYFLYEYEQYLMTISEYGGEKVSWSTFTQGIKNHVTIEHILPQTANKDCWTSDFGTFSNSQKTILCNNLGNLLLLSKPKNSSLQNDCFFSKKSDIDSTQGYFNGSYSETRLANKYVEWTAIQIMERSLEMIAFFENRWNVSFGDDSYQLELLQLSFLKPIEVITSP